MTNIDNLQDGDKRKRYRLELLGEAFANTTVEE
jgi:hypothetical protein